MIEISSFHLVYDVPIIIYYYTHHYTSVRPLYKILYMIHCELQFDICDYRLSSYRQSDVQNIMV